MKPFLACAPSKHAPRKSSPVMVHHDLEHARLHAKSTDKPMAYAPPEPFSLFGMEGDALMIHTDGLCRRVRLWVPAPKRKWVWHGCAAFDPATKKLDPSLHLDRIVAAA